MDVYMALVLPFAGTYAPVYFMNCYGQALPQGQYQAIYALIGQLYGNTTTSDFKLPDLQCRSIVGAGVANFTTGQVVYQVAKGGGLPMVRTTLIGQAAISASNLPQHSHGATFTPVTGSVPVNIPAQPQKGTLSGSASIPINAATGNAGNVPSNTANYLSSIPVGTNSKFPYTTTAPSGAAVTLNPVTVPVTPSADYSAPVQASSAVISGVVTGGAVQVSDTGVSGTTTAPVQVAMNAQTQSPYLPMTFIFAMQGLWPSRD
ncbi:MAG: phage tail protein [Actinomycetota bacterium]